MGEARQHPRYAVEATIELHASSGVARGRSRDVSRGGLAATVDTPLAIGEHVSVRLALVFDAETLSEPLELPARIVWCTSLGEEHQVGMAFLPLGDDSTRYLQLFLRYLQEGASDDDDAGDDPGEPDDLFG